MPATKLPNPMLIIFLKKQNKTKQNKTKKLAHKQEAIASRSACLVNG